MGSDGKASIMARFDLGPNAYLSIRIFEDFSFMNIWKILTRSCYILCYRIWEKLKPSSYLLNE